MGKVTKTFQRSIGWRAIRHGVVESEIHKQDVEAAAERRETFWLGVELAPQAKPHRIIDGLGGGMYFTRDRKTGLLVERRGDDFVLEMDSWKIEKSYYLRQIEDKERVDKKGKLHKAGTRWKKTHTQGIQGLVITCAPWYSDVIFKAAEAGDTARVKEFSAKAALELQSEFENQTKREVLSVQSHFDTRNLHFHIFSTRIGSDNKFLPGTRKSFGLIGPWACGTLRLGEAGLLPANSTNYRVANDLRTKTRDKRLGGMSPLDWKLCQCVDLLCMGLFGSSAGLTSFMALYHKGQTEQAFARLLGLQTAVEKEVNVWKRHLSMPRDYVGVGVRGASVLDDLIKFK